MTVSRSILPAALLLLAAGGALAAAEGISVQGPPGATPPKVQQSVRPAPPARPPIDWGTDVRWMSYEEGLAAAKKSGKPILLVVFSERCPRCHELAPVFKDPEVAKLASALVMVRQDGDQPVPWLTGRYGAAGTYVPRLLFLKPDGTFREELVGPNPKYPHYYWPAVVEDLKDDMRVAAGGKPAPPAPKPAPVPSAPALGGAPAKK